MSPTTTHVSRGESRLNVTVEGAGPPLLYLHGLTGQASLALNDAPAGYRVATYDQRGHASGTPFVTASAYAIEEFVDDALAVLRELGWERAAVGGSSMGAAIALRLALDHPDLVEMLILTGPAFGAEPNPVLATEDEMARQLEEFGIPETILLRRAAMLELGAPLAATAILDTWIAHDARSHAMALRTVGQWVPFPDLEEARRLPMPVVVLAWPDDAMHPLELAERLVELTAAPLVLLSGLAEVLGTPGAVSRALTALLHSSGLGPDAQSQARHPAGRGERR